MHVSPKTIPAVSPAANTYFFIALFLINTLAFTLLICTLGFLVGIPISKWQFPTGCLLALFCNFFVFGYFSNELKNIRLWKVTGTCLGLIVGLMLFSSSFYDVSFDGQWYHQETVIRLKEGWNPVYNQIAVPPNETTIAGNDVWCLGVDKVKPILANDGQPAVNLKFLNINHFSKGIEIIESSIYILSNRIESGKAVNGIFLLASFFLALSFLYPISRLNKSKKWMFALLISFNPIAITQLLTYCVDGVMASALICIVITSCLLFGQSRRRYLGMLAALIILACNIKFTSLLFTALICAGLLTSLFLYHKKTLLKKLFLLCLFSAIIGIVLVGFHPYMTNQFRQGNMLFRLKETQREIIATTPSPLLNLNRFEKLVISLASHTDSYLSNNSPIREMIKVPFTVNKTELLNADDPEVKFSALGPFFSGALLIALVLFMALCLRFRNTAIFKQELILLTTISISIFALHVCWWGRFVPQIWLIPVSLMFVAEFFTFRGSKIMRTGLGIVLGLNIAWAALSIVFNLFITSHMHYQLNQLQALHQPVTVEYCPYRSFTSNRVRFSEHNIPFREGPVTGNYIDNIIHSNTRFSTDQPLPSLPKPLLLRWHNR